MSSASPSSWASLDGIQLRKSGERGCGSRVPIVGPHVEGAVGFGDAGLAEHALVVGQHVSCDSIADGGTEDGDGRLRHGRGNRSASGLCALGRG